MQTIKDSALNDAAHQSHSLRELSRGAGVVVNRWIGRDGRNWREIGRADVRGRWAFETQVEIMQGVWV